MYIVCYRTCWGCKFDMHADGPHPWWDHDDVEYAEEAGKPLPEGDCACYCNEKESNDEAA